MNTNEFNYYFIFEDNGWNNVPLLDNDHNKDREMELELGLDFLYLAQEVPEGHVANLCFFESVKNPYMDTDCLTADGFEVFSKKVRDELEKHMPIKYLQLVPTVIEEGKYRYTDFYIPNMCQRIFTFDEKLSDYECIDEEFGSFENIKKIVLDREKLSKIPLEDRLVYVAHEDSQFRLYHESIIDIIKSVNPVGMRIVRVEEWTSGALFDFMRE